MPPADGHQRVIAHVLHRLDLAGAEKLAADLARALCDRFWFVFFCLDGLGPLAEQLSREGFAVESLGRRPGVDLSVARALRDACRAHHVNLIHAHQYTPFFYAALSRARPTRYGPLFGGPRIVFTEHGRHYPDPRKLSHRIVNHTLLRRGDRVTAVGKFIKRALVCNEGIPERRIEVITNGIPADFASSVAAAARQRVRAAMGLNNDQPVILQVARFHSVKDHATALRAFAAVAQRHTNAVLLLAGDGEQRSDCQRLAAALGVADRVQFLGVRTDVADLMAGADVLCLSSLSEGICVTLLEAMASGLPIAATNVGGNPEVVEHPATGLLSPRQDPEQLAEHLSTLIGDADLRRRMGAAGRQRFIEQFTQARMHQRYAELYRELLQ